MKPFAKFLSLRVGVIVDHGSEQVQADNYTIELPHRNCFFEGSNAEMIGKHYLNLIFKLIQCYSI